MLKANNLWEANQLRKITTVAACDEKINQAGEWFGRSRTEAERDDCRDKIAFLKKLREQLAA